MGKTPIYSGRVKFCGIGAALCSERGKNGPLTGWWRSANEGLNGMKSKPATGYRAGTKLLRGTMMILLFLVTAGSVIGLGYLAMGTALFESGGPVSNAAHGLVQIFVFTVVGIAIGIFVLALLDCWGTEQETASKNLWLAVMILAPVVGPLLWFAMGRRLAERANERCAA
jgi:multisubunit Na+/H+ antiporter MnhC subunit